jgi:predicted nucleotidyltransferase
LQDVARHLSADFFVVGAMARDIILESAHGIPTIRATKDIDLGVQVSDWEIFEELKKGLINTGKFHSTRDIQRLKYENSLPVDIIPFGKIAGTDRTFTWPPDNDTKMSALGYDEAYENSLPVQLNSDPIVHVRFASLPGLAIMKLISWEDQYPDRGNDAKDLLLIMRNYLSAGNEKRLYQKEADLLDYDFDYELASSRLLGRDMASIARPGTGNALMKILDQETGNRARYRLIEQMVSTA